MEESADIQAASPFEFLLGLGYAASDVRRMNLRHRHVIEPVRAELKHARVLDLGSHDGRWPFALVKAGANGVVGIEGRAAMIAKFADYPQPEVKARVQLIQGDFVREMDRMLAAGERFDVVACLGVYYHTMHHYMMLEQMAGFKPKAIVVDNVFSLANRPLITIGKEPTESRLNAIAQQEGQAWVPAGQISRSGFEILVASVGYTVQWINWLVPPGRRGPVKDYFEPIRGYPRQRFTAVLRPVA